MIEWKSFVDSLSPEEFKNLSAEIWKRKTNEAESEVKKIKLTDYEKDLIATGRRSEAVKQIRTRLNCSLLLAKTIVDKYSTNPDLK